LADVTMPQLGETVTEGTITKWFKAIVTRWPEMSPCSRSRPTRSTPRCPRGRGGADQDSGRGRRHRRRGVTLAVIADASSADGASTDSAASDDVAPASAGDSAPTPAAGATEPPSASAPPPPAPPSPAPPPARRPRPQRPLHCPRPRHHRCSNAAPLNGSRGGLVLSPVVRKLLSESRIDPADITGTGLGGRITATTSRQPSPRVCRRDT